MKFCDTGDIASKSGLDGCNVPFYTYGFTCSQARYSLCSVELQSVPLPYVDVCEQIGKAIIINFFEEPGHKPYGSPQIQAVVGFGNVSSAGCTFARKPSSPLAIVKIVSTGQPSSMHNAGMKSNWSHRFSTIGKSPQAPHRQAVQPVLSLD